MRMLLLILLFIQKLQSGTPPGEGRDCCSWDGVECDIDTGHVIGLNLGGSCLYGTINSSNSLLHFLKLAVLDLTLNPMLQLQKPALRDLVQNFAT